MQKLKERISNLNDVIDHYLIQYHLKKKPIHPLVDEIPTLLQALIMNLKCGSTLETSIRTIIQSQEHHHAYSDIIKFSDQEGSALLGLNKIAQIADDSALWRLVQLLNQYHTTGSRSAIDALEYFYKEIWDKKETAIKNKSERISMLLTFILMLSFISVITVISAPILLMFNNFF